MNTVNFSSQVTEYAKTNGTLRLDLNYETLARAKAYPKDCLWLQWLDTGWGERESVEISLEQAKWLVEELPLFIKMLEGDENANG